MFLPGKTFYYLVKTSYVGQLFMKFQRTLKRRSAANSNSSPIRVVMVLKAREKHVLVFLEDLEEQHKTRIDVHALVI